MQPLYVQVPLLAATVTLAGCRPTTRVWPPRGAVCEAAAPEASPAVRWADAPPGRRAGPEVARRLQGAYDVAQVTTEGVERPVAVRWRLRLVPMDDSVRPRCLAGTCPAGGRPVLLAGVRERPGDPFDSVAAAGGRFRGPDAVEVRYDSVRGTLSFATDPGVLDGGEVFQVAAVTDSGLVGRWVDGGIVAAWVRRSDVTTFERARGFFCASRLTNR